MIFLPEFLTGYCFKVIDFADIVLIILYCLLNVLDAIIPYSCEAESLISMSEELIVGFKLVGFKLLVLLIEGYM